MEDQDHWAAVKEAQRRTALLSVQSAYRQMVKIHTGTIKLLDEPSIDDYGTVTIGSWGGYLIQVFPMIFNDRLVMTPMRAPDVYDFGWCFQRGAAAYLAAAVWDPEQEAEPQGFKKRVGPIRRAGEDVEEELTPGEGYALGLAAFLDAVTRR